MPLIINQENGLEIVCKEIICGEKVFSNETVQSNVEHLTTFLKNHSTYTATPFVYLYAFTHVKTILAFLAILKAGLTCVLIEPDIGKLELEESKKELPPCIIIKIDPGSPDLHWQKELIFQKEAMGPRLEEHWDIKPSSIIIYASEQNSFCLPVQHTLQSFLTNTRAVLHCNKYAHNTVIYPVLSFAHIFALQICLSALLVPGGTLVIPDIYDKLNIKKMAEQIESYKVTHIYSIPIIYYYWARVPEMNTKWNSIQSLVSGSYKLPSRVINLYKEKFNLNIQEGYGLSEASICSWHYMDDLIVPESVGRAFPYCELKIMGRHNRELPCNKDGEVCVKGENVMVCYYNNPEATARAIKDGWLYTGDLGKLDRNGYLYLTGLKKAMLNVIGKKVYIKELERLILCNPNVLKVKVFGSYSELVGNTIEAKIKLKNNTKEEQADFNEWCKMQITGFKIPKKMLFH